MTSKLIDLRRPVNARELWISVLGWYVPIVVVANLVWETAHLPLYTVWSEATAPYLLFVVVHCTGGDLLIALSALALALLLTAPLTWPRDRFALVVLIATFVGTSYTIFSEWLNTEIRKSWQYSDLMPVVPVIDTGLSPLLQWLIIPPVGLWIARRSVMARRSAWEAVRAAPK